jgi:DNA-binding transcriptional ArsR family regulator
MTLENTMRIVERVERTHKNLGLACVFAKLIDFSDWGCFIVGERAKGKGAILGVVEQLRHRTVMEVARLTPAGLKRIADKLNGAEVTFINPDVSTLYNPYMKDAMINCMAHLISEHRLPPSWTDRYEYQIENCRISFLSGVQPKMMKTINQLPQWESMYRDRFIRFYLFYPLGTPKWRETYPNVGEILIPDMPIDNVNIPESILKSPEYERMRSIIERQTSEGRSRLIMNRLLKAHAYLNGREAVVKEDIDFLQLFALNLLTDHWLSVRMSPSGSLYFDPDAYVILFKLIEEGEVERRALAEYFKVSKDTLMKHIKPLVDANIVSGTFGKPRYRLNPKWEERYVKPIKDWYKERGL